MLFDHVSLNYCFLMRAEGIKCVLQLNGCTVDASRDLWSQNRNMTSVSIATTSSWQSYL